ncbi:MAG: cation diffusion facilitator family transporter [Candidatus Bathyarchaeia archaeon]
MREDYTTIERLRLVIIITSVIFVAEVIGGLISNSFALLSDSAHMMMHIFAIGIGFGAAKLADRPSNKGATFGYHRSEILAALINGLTVIGIAFLVFYGAYVRALSPLEVKSAEMLSIAMVGLFGNVWVARVLRGAQDLNIKGIFLHVIADTLSSVVVVTAGILIMLTGIYIIDPILSFLIGGIILISSYGLVRDSVNILMEGTPRHIDPDDVVRRVCNIDGVRRLHDVHIWSLSSNLHALSAHVLVDSIHVRDTERLIKEINRCLAREYNITHTTLQFECRECEEGAESNHR